MAGRRLIFAYLARAFFQKFDNTHGPLLFGANFAFAGFIGHASRRQKTEKGRKTKNLEANAITFTSAITSLFVSSSTTHDEVEMRSARSTPPYGACAWGTCQRGASPPARP